jgi:hypothetical protein
MSAFLGGFSLSVVTGFETPQIFAKKGVAGGLEGVYTLSVGSRA